MRGTYKRTAETKAKRQQTFYKSFLSNMNWKLAEPYLDTEIDNGSAGRCKKRLTLREYRDRMLSGDYTKNLIHEGVSKHLLQFMSNLCQGKISLTKEEFLKEYIAGLDLDEIAANHKIQRCDMGFLRQLYGIKRKGFEYQNRKRTEIAMTDRQKEICYGSMMGDAKRQSTRFNTSMGFGHGDKQKDYLYWKFCELNSISSKTSFKATRCIDRRSGYEGISWRFYTKANSDIQAIIDEFYKNGTKEVSHAILDHMTSLSVAVWFMDDGKTDWYHRVLVLHPNRTIIPMPQFCTECFSYESCLLMQKWFKEKWNISTRLTKRQLKDRMGYRVTIDGESVQSFFDLIRPHIIPSMLYKIDYEEYCRYRKNRTK